MSNKYTKSVLTYEWHCAACNQIARESREHTPGMTFFLPTKPAGWLAFSRGTSYAFYCPLHKIVEIMFVDGKQVLPDAPWRPVCRAQNCGEPAISFDHGLCGRHIYGRASGGDA